MAYVIRFLIIFFIFINSAKADIHEQSTIPELQQDMRNGKLTSEQLVKYYLKRIKQYDANGMKLNSVVQINQHAIEQAKALDVKLKRGDIVGPLHGIPVLLKDNIDTVDGMANTAGSIALKDNHPKKEAFVVTQLKNAGAIILGKTNLSEWANFRSTASSSGWSGLYGQTKNPYDVTRSPCGSSSGSGVAVAANLTTIAIGTETDGSVTCPSAINGIVGIKPTIGTVSRDGIIPIAHSQDTAGPMARNVTDAVILLSAMVAPDPTDSMVETSTIDYMSHLKAHQLKGKRIGIARDFTSYHKGLDKVFEQAINDLKAQGAIIVDNVTFASQSQWGDAEFEVLLYEFKHDLNNYLSQTAKGLPKSLKDIINFNHEHANLEMPYFGQEIMMMAQSKGDLLSPKYKDALKTSKTATQENGIDLVMKQHSLDMLVAPTTGPAWKTDWVNGDHYLGAASSVAAISGYPHITVPMGYVHQLPVGLSFIGGKLQEGILIEAAYSYEQATEHRKPPKLN